MPASLVFLSIEAMMSSKIQLFSQKSLSDVVVTSREEATYDVTDLHETQA